jgi:hypothetical protein
MIDGTWRDQLAGHRMQVDGEFDSRVRESELTNAEWNLVMTAVEFEVEGEGESARLVADTSKVPSVVPEFENLSRGDVGGVPSGGDSGGGLLDSVKEALSFGNSGEDEKLQVATALAEEYAAELQAHLEERGRWESIRRAANSDVTDN